MIFHITAFGQHIAAGLFVAITLCWLVPAQARQPYSNLVEMWANMPPKTPPAALTKADDLIEWLPGRTIAIIGRGRSKERPRVVFFAYVIDTESYELLGQRYNLKIDGNLLCALECFLLNWDKSGRLVAYYYFDDHENAYGVIAEQGKRDLFETMPALVPSSSAMVPRRTFDQNKVRY